MCAQLWSSTSINFGPKSSGYSRTRHNPVARRKRPGRGTGDPESVLFIYFQVHVSNRGSEEAKNAAEVSKRPLESEGIVNEKEYKNLLTCISARQYSHTAHKNQGLQVRLRAVSWIQMWGCVEEV